MVNHTVTMIKNYERLSHVSRIVLVLASVLTGALAISLIPNGSAKGAVEVSDMKLPQMIEVYGPFKPDHPELMGDYPTKVDFSYIGGRDQGHGKKLGVPYGRLVGIYGTKDRPAFIPESRTVVWSKVLSRLWKEKLSDPNVSGATRKWADHVVEGYTNSHRDIKSIKTYISQVDSQARMMHGSINYGRMCSVTKLSNCTALYKTMGRIRGKNLAAYGMTELFPSNKGEFNYIMLDMILRNAGENYLHSIPSNGDSLLSKGVYQWTSYAIRRDSSGSLGGVTFVDNFAGRHLAGSVVHLKPEDAHKAAFAFVTYNIITVMKGLSSSESERLSSHCPIDQITQSIAVLHHQPKTAVPAIQSWVKKGCDKPLQVYLNPHLKEYASKTAANYSALEHHIHTT
jgi:hypothetical protein